MAEERQSSSPEILDERATSRYNWMNQVEFDARHGYEPVKTEIWPKTRKLLAKTCPCTPNWFLRSFLSFFPIIKWLPKYRIKEHFLGDLIAGLTVGVMHIPQGLAFAALAETKPIYGLYTSFFPPLLYMFLGTSHHLAVGSYAISSLMVGNFLIENRQSLGIFTETTTTSGSVTTEEMPLFNEKIREIELLTALTLTVGIVQLTMAVLRLDFLTQFLSDQVVRGFITGAACHVFTSQFPKLLGISRQPYSGPGNLFFVYKGYISDIGSCNLYTLLLSGVTILVLVILKDVANPWLKNKKSPVPIPSELIVVVFGTAASHFLNFENYGIGVVGDVPKGFQLSVPRFELMARSKVLTFSMSIALVCFITNISLGKIYARKHAYKIDPRQELYAFGISGCICAFLGCFPGGSALARAAVYEAAGVKTHVCHSFPSTILATVFSCGLLLIVLLFVGPLFYYLPTCILASIVIVALKGMFLHITDLHTLWPLSKIDFSMWLASFLATLCLDVDYGLAFAIIFALLTLTFRFQRPNSGTLGRLKDVEMFVSTKRFSQTATTPIVGVFQFEFALVFVNCELFRETLLDQFKIDITKAKKSIKRAEKRKNDAERGAISSISSNIGSAGVSPQKIKAKRVENFEMAGKSEQTAARTADYPTVIILDFSGVNQIDVSGKTALKQVIEELAEVGVGTYLADVNPNVRILLEKSDFYDENFPLSRQFPSVRDAFASITAV